MSRTPEDIALPIRRRVNDEPGLLDSAEEGLQREIYLQACERTAEASVDAAAPSEVLVVPAFGIELVRVGEPARVLSGA